MIHQVKLLPKAKQKIKNIKSSLNKVPDNWEDFTRLTTIRSGGEMRKFELYDYQKILIELSNKYTNIIVLKSRQLGVTQTILSKFLHDACINPASSSILFMRNSEDASAISRRARQMLLSIPEYVQPSNDTVQYLKIKNGGDLYFKNSGKEGSRSLDSCTGLLFDEVAFVPNIQDIYAASNPSSALSGDRVKKFIVSTPSAKSGWYWDRINENNGNIDIEQLTTEVANGSLYKQVRGCYWFVDAANCCKVVLHYTCHPVYSQINNYLAYRQQQDGTDEETIQREYNLAFIDSSVAVFTSDLIRANATGEYEVSRDKEGVYYCGLDTATSGDDYTTLSVLKEKNGIYSLAYLYRKRHTTSENHIYKIGEILKVFKPERTGVETTGGVGVLYLEQLSRDFPGLYFEGVRTTGDSKPIMLSTMVLALERRLLKYPQNSPLVSEMLSFRRQGRKLEAAQNAHDDTVMSTAFALCVSPFNRDKSFVDSSKIKTVETSFLDYL